MQNAFGGASYTQHVPRQGVGGSGFVPGGAVNPGIGQDVSGSNGYSIPWTKSDTELHGPISDAHTTNLDIGPVCESFPVSLVRFMCKPSSNEIMIPRGTVIGIVREHAKKRGGSSGGTLYVFNSSTSTAKTQEQNAMVESLASVCTDGAQWDDGPLFDQSVNIPLAQVIDSGKLFVSVLASDLKATATPQQNQLYKFPSAGQSVYASIVVMGTCEMIPIMGTDNWFSGYKAMPGMVCDIMIPKRWAAGNGNRNSICNEFWTTGFAKFIVKVAPQRVGPIIIYMC